MIGSLPAPLSVDPFDGSLVTWTFPFVLLEVVLLLSIVMDVVLDRKASRTGASEVGFACAVVLLSWGPAGIIAVIRGIVSSVRGGRGVKLVLSHCFSNLTHLSGVGTPRGGPSLGNGHLG